MAENTSNTPTSGATTRKPAARGNRSTSSRSRSRGSAANRNRNAGGGANIQTGGGATPNAQNDDWRGLNRIISRYMAAHPQGSIGETTVGELLAWAEQKRPRTMTAGGGAHA